VSCTPDGGTEVDVQVNAGAHPLVEPESIGFKS
jgi:hypothetical protein